MFSKTRFKIRNERESTVAAAGFILKHENIKAKLRIALALMAINACEQMNSRNPSFISNALNIPNGGNMTNIDFHGNQSRANTTAINPSTATRIAEKIT